MDKISMFRGSDILGVPRVMPCSDLTGQVSLAQNLETHGGIPNATDGEVHGAVE